VYATVLNVKCNSDGYKEKGIMYPSRDMHKLLLDECYQGCGASKNLLEYFEGHGTGTKVSLLKVKQRPIFFFSNPLICADDWGTWWSWGSEVCL
jgi:hypothetical protein